MYIYSKCKFQIERLEALETSTKGINIFNKLKCRVETLLLKNDDLIWSKLESVCTNGAPCMIGKNIGRVTLLEEFLNIKLNKYHCITLIHLESLCTKVLKFDHVLKPVSRRINKIKARPLNHRLFRTLFEDVINESGELLLFCEVRWLAKGKALERFWNIKNEIIEFLENNNELPDECKLLRDKNWLNDLAFLTDIFGHLNILNKRFQGEGNLFPVLVGFINSFMSRLCLFESNLEMGNLDHFVRLKSIYLPTDTPLTIFKNHISTLFVSSQERFCRFKEEEYLNNLFINPFIISTDDLQKYNPNMQLEIIELQSSTVLKCKYKELPDIVEFWKCVSE
uniref:General transcription factor II-I repeat domain-containing protein 2 n=1 Tax=Schizaphis graminum TaxID=13262 RepID=A0A2S2NFQ3_SCHGA